MNAPVAAATGLNRETALRIALAARAMPGVSVGQLLEVLNTRIAGGLDADSLKTVTVTDIKAGLAGVENEEDGMDPGIALADMKSCVRILWGEDDTDALPPLQAPFEDRSGVLRVAVASNNNELLDGHFGSCLRFLVYEMSRTELRLVDIRSTVDADLAEDRNAFRAELIGDCQVLFVQSIGGPAAAKVVRAGLYPLKMKDTSPAREALERLQEVMVSSPPPWMAKLLGVNAEQRARFDRDEEWLPSDAAMTD